MTERMKTPAECETKQDVRSEIDRLDQELINLFAERHGYVIRMAAIKSDPHEAYDKARIETVIEKKVRAARWRNSWMRIKPNCFGAPLSTGM